MITVTLACVLTGMAVGLRFKVLMIVPVIIFAILFTGAMMVVQGDHIWAILPAIVLNAIGVQVGYLCGTFAQSMLRESHRPDQAISPSPRASTYKAGAGVSARAH